MARRRKEKAFIATGNGFIPDFSEKDDPSFFPDSYRGLYELGFRKDEADANPSWTFMQKISRYFLFSLFRSPGLELAREKVDVVYDRLELDEIVSSSPFMLGSSFVDSDWAMEIIGHLEDVFREDIASFDGTVDTYLSRKNSAFTLPSRIFFHLVENRKGPTPFAFIATYSTVDEDGVLKHFPLKYALYEYRKSLDRITVLIASIRRAAKKSAIINRLLESGEIFHPLNMDEYESYEFLKDVPLYEEEGIVVRIPQWWKGRKRKTSIKLEMAKNRTRITDSLFEMVPYLTYEGVPITDKEARELLKQTEGLSFLKGQWVEIDHSNLERLLGAFDELSDEELTLFRAVKLSSGVEKLGVPVRCDIASILESFRKEFFKGELPMPSGFEGTLRPYQKNAYDYMALLKKLGLGMLLADDMGLGKTVEVISFLEREREEKPDMHVLLVVPASLMGNWKAEVEKFAPDMSLQIFHGKKILEDSWPFLTITTYQTGSKSQKLKDQNWDIMILDEAQGIKNPNTQQTNGIKSFKRRYALALTGTPVENRLLNMWSIFDFLLPGLLGSEKEFKEFEDTSQEGENMKVLKDSIRPFIMRRLKTDKSIITDLPEKNEIEIRVGLSKEQTILYNNVVEEYARKVEGEEELTPASSMATIMKLKAIVNHPDQYLGEGAYKENESGKFMLLRDIAENIHENRERVLVFSQFTEIIPHLVKLLETVFGEEGLVITGSTPVSKRSEIVEKFQTGRIPFMVLSLRAAGVGLNLTKAENVIHFDRWWNPAVEDQATDRTYRIGQEKNVTVYKFLTSGTIEESISEMLQDKKTLSDDVLGEVTGNVIRDLSPGEILDAMRFRGNI